MQELEALIKNKPRTYFGSEFLYEILFTPSGFRKHFSRVRSRLDYCIDRSKRNRGFFEKKILAIIQTIRVTVAKFLIMMFRAFRKLYKMIRNLCLQILSVKTLNLVFKKQYLWERVVARGLFLPVHFFMLSSVYSNNKVCLPRCKTMALYGMLSVALQNWIAYRRSGEKSAKSTGEG